MKLLYPFLSIIFSNFSLINMVTSNPIPESEKKNLSRDMLALLGVCKYGNEQDFKIMKKYMKERWNINVNLRKLS